MVLTNASGSPEWGSDSRAEVEVREDLTKRDLLGERLSNSDAMANRVELAQKGAH